MKVKIPSNLSTLTLEQLKAKLGEITGRIGELENVESITDINERTALRGYEATFNMLITTAESALAAEEAAQAAAQAQADADAQAATAQAATADATQAAVPATTDDAATTTATTDGEGDAAPEGDTQAPEGDAATTAAAPAAVVTSADTQAPATADGAAVTSNANDASADGQEGVEVSLEAIDPSFSSLAEAFDGTQRGQAAVSRKLVNAAVIDSGKLSADEITRQIMSIPTPSGERASDEDRTRLINAAYCTPYEELRDIRVEGGYERDIFNSLRSFNMRGLGLTWAGRFNPAASGLVDEVDLTDDPIVKFETEYTCVTPVTAEAHEVKAAFTMLESTKFASDLATEVLIDEANSYLAAKADNILLDKIIDLCHPYSKAAVSKGFVGDTAAALAEMLEKMEQSSPLTNIDSSWRAYLPKSFVWYSVADGYLRAYSRDEAQSDAETLFNKLGISVTVYDDFIDPTHTVVALPAVGGSATALTLRAAWAIPIIRPDDAFVGVRTENKYGLEEVPPSKATLDANEVAFFARAWELLGKIGPGNWSVATLSAMGLGGSVAPGAVTIL